MNPNQHFGKSSEALAARYLQENGYRILATNYRTKEGEIDIVARDGNTTVFVEVKARRSSHFGHPKYAVSRRKQQKISMAALRYLKAAGQSRAKARFDVVSILSDTHPPRIELIRNAFYLAYG